MNYVDIIYLSCAEKCYLLLKSEQKGTKDGVMLELWAVKMRKWKKLLLNVLNWVYAYSLKIIGF